MPCQEMKGCTGEGNFAADIDDCTGVLEALQSRAPLAVFGNTSPMDLQIIWMLVCMIVCRQILPSV